MGQPAKLRQLVTEGRRQLTERVRFSDQLAGEIRTAVFHLLDREPDLDGNQAGRVAHAVEQAARQALKRELGEAQGEQTEAKDTRGGAEKLAAYWTERTGKETKVDDTIRGWWRLTQGPHTVFFVGDTSGAVFAPDRSNPATKYGKKLSSNAAGYVDFLKREAEHPAPKTKQTPDWVKKARGW